MCEGIAHAKDGKGEKGGLGNKGLRKMILNVGFFPALAAPTESGQAGWMGGGVDY